MFESCREHQSNQMTEFLESFALIFTGEIGDKTQLLALILVTRFHKPWQIMGGILVATLLNHAIAAWFGNVVAQQFDPQILKYSLAAIFFGFAAWILIPDKEEEFKTSRRANAFLTTLVAFFFAEIGDKTQLATIALGAKSTSLISVILGTTLGMLASNALVVFFGKKLLKKIPMKWIRIFTCALFALFGFLIIL